MGRSGLGLVCLGCHSQSSSHFLHDKGTRGCGEVEVGRDRGAGRGVEVILQANPKAAESAITSSHVTYSLFVVVVHVCGNVITDDCL